MERKLKLRAPYAPLPGSIAGNVIAHLKTLEHGEELSTAALAQALGQMGDNFGQALASAVRSDMLRRRMEGHCIFWSLGRNSDGNLPPAMPPLAEQESQRVVAVSALAMPSVFAYAQNRQAAPFSVSISTDGRLVAERHGRVVVEFTNAEREQLLATASCADLVAA
jgi:hypothetical protein